MLHGESRFFINWQMPKSVSTMLYNDEPETHTDVLNEWLETTGIYERIQFELDPVENQQHMKILQTI